jgi:IS30 family transposase
MPGPEYTAEQQQHFFDLIDGGGTVKAAAMAAGVHPDAAYTWLRGAGLTMRRRTPRVYTDGERAEFLRLLGELHNVRAAAAALGFPAVTCLGAPSRHLRQQKPAGKPQGAGVPTAPGTGADPR